MVGCFDSSSSILVYFQILYDAGLCNFFYVPLIYVAAGIFVLIRSILLVPTGTIPHDLPSDYVLLDQSVVSKLRHNSVTPIEKALLPNVNIISFDVITRYIFIAEKS